MVMQGFDLQLIRFVASSAYVQRCVEVVIDGSGTVEVGRDEMNGGEQTPHPQLRSSAKRTLVLRSRRLMVASIPGRGVAVARSSMLFDSEWPLGPKVCNVFLIYYLNILIIVLV